MALTRSPMKRGTSTLKTTKPISRGAGFKQTSKPIRKTSKAPAARSTLKAKTPKNAPNAAEKAHMGRVAALGCALCWKLGYGITPAEIHHPRRGTGMGQRASHFDVIGLCPEHHRGNTGLHGLGTKRFAEVYGTDEAELLAAVRAAMGQYSDITIITA